MKRYFLFVITLLPASLKADAQVQHTALDTNFAIRGIYLGGTDPSMNQQCKVSLGRTGTIVLAKTDVDLFSSQPGSWLRLRRLQPGGAPDNTFGTGGMVGRLMPLEWTLAGAAGLNAATLLLSPAISAGVYQLAIGADGYTRRPSAFASADIPFRISEGGFAAKTKAALS